MISPELQTFYESSPMREGVLCWYPFDNDASVLDLSSGALTDLLRNRCRIVVSSEMPISKTFDYIVVLDPENFSNETLVDYKASLNAHGRLLLAYENPFALRYWSGKPDPKNGLPYYPLFGCDGRPGMAELRIRLKTAGFKGQKWYYPLTDHWFAREIYSESYLPDEFLNHRFRPYIADYQSLCFDERGLYREVIRGGAFEFMCGAYLVEARMCAEDAPCVVDYAAVTAYREPAKRFTTAVCSDNIVKKVPLCPEGKQSLLNILRNHEELADAGINVIKVTLEGDSLIMPRIGQPTLWDYWASKLDEGTFDKNEMFSQFDRIREAIITAYDKTGKCFWELVPANCFYDAANDKMIFFDQEYYWEGASPDIAVARALWALLYPSVFNTYPHTKQWLEELKTCYNLAEQWDEISVLANAKTYNEVFGDGDLKLKIMTNQTADRLRLERKKSRNGTV